MKKKSFITSGPGFMFFCVKYMLNFDGYVSKVCKKTLNNEQFKTSWMILLLNKEKRPIIILYSLIQV